LSLLSLSLYQWRHSAQIWLEIHLSLIFFSFTNFFVAYRVLPIITWWYYYFYHTLSIDYRAIMHNYRTLPFNHRAITLCKCSYYRVWQYFKVAILLSVSHYVGYIVAIVLVFCSFGLDCFLLRGWFWDLGTLWAL